MTIFTASERFEVAVKKHYGRLTLDHKGLRRFWKQEGASHYKTKRGCYIFGITHGKKIVPTYVGKATKSYAQEVLQEHKKKQHYNAALKERKNGKAVIIFISLQYRKKPNILSIDNLET